MVLDKLIHKAINGEDFHSFEAAFLAIAMFAAGFFVSIPTPATGYDTACEDLYKDFVFNYTGSIDDYDGEWPTDLYASSDNGSVLLASSDQLHVANGSTLNFSFTETVTVTCTDGDIQVDPFLFDEKLQNHSTGDA